MVGASITKSLNLIPQNQVLCVSIFEWTPRQTYLTFLLNMYKIIYPHTTAYISLVVYQVYLYPHTTGYLSLVITGYLSGLPIPTHHYLSLAIYQVYLYRRISAYLFITCVLCLMSVISDSFLQSHFVFLPVKSGKWILLGCRENQLGVFSHFSPWSNMFTECHQ